jgi:hypothetical protein
VGFFESKFLGLFGLDRNMSVPLRVVATKWYVLKQAEARISYHLSNFEKTKIQIRVLFEF